MSIVIAAFVFSKIYPKSLDVIPAGPSLALFTGSSDKQVVLRGCSTAKYTDDDKVAVQLKIGKCEIRPGNKGLWNLGTEKVAALSEVQIDFFSWPPSGNSGRQQAAATAARPVLAEPSQVLDCMKDLSKRSGWESVRGFEMRDVTINLHQENKRFLCLHAQKLSPEAKGQFVLEGDVKIIAEDSHRQLASQRVVWWPKLGIFAVKDLYSLTDAGQERQGTRTIFKQNLESVTHKAQIDDYQKLAQHKGASEP